jgi:hypothetical protein
MFGIVALGQFEMQQRGFQARAGGPVFDALDHAAQVQHARETGRIGAGAGSENAPQPPSQ